MNTECLGRVSKASASPAWEGEKIYQKGVIISGTVEVDITKTMTTTLELTTFLDESHLNGVIRISYDTEVHNHGSVDCNSTLLFFFR